MKPWLDAIVMLVSVSVAAAESNAITMEEALRRAEEAGPAARIITLEVERARAQVRSSGLWSNPEIFLSREDSAGTVERFSNLSLTLPVWGRPGLERAAARSGLTAALALADQGRIALRALVREAFVDLLVAQEQTRWLEAGRARLTELVEVLRARERVGESSGFDRMRAERALAEVQVDHLEALAKLAAARAFLGALLDLPPVGLEASGSLAAHAPLPPVEDLRVQARSRGDLRALEAAAEQAEHLARAARRRVLPEPTVTAGTKTTESGSSDDSGPILAVGFSLPIFDRGQGARVAHSEAAILQAQRQRLALQVEAGITAAHATAAGLREAEAAYLGAADPEGLVRIARSAYDAGEMRIFELLDAYRTALGVRLRALALQASARRADVDLNRALGREVVP